MHLEALAYNFFISAHAFEHRSQVIDVDVHIRLAVFRTTVDKDVIKVSLCVSSMRTEQLRHETIKCRWGVDKTLWHNQPFP